MFVSNFPELSFCSPLADFTKSPNLSRVLNRFKRDLKFRVLIC